MASKRILEATDYMVAGGNLSDRARRGAVWFVRACFAWFVCAGFYEGIQVYIRDPPLFADLEASQMAVSQPLRHRALVHLKTLSDVGGG